MLNFGINLVSDSPFGEDAWNKAKSLEDSVTRASQMKAIMRAWVIGHDWGHALFSDIQTFVHQRSIDREGEAMGWNLCVGSWFAGNEDLARSVLRKILGAQQGCWTKMLRPAQAMSTFQWSVHFDGAT